jgi:predicted nucleic acid-binding protein
MNMDKPCFMLDSSVIIGHLNHTLDLFAFFEAQGECDIYINLITEIETLAKPDMNGDEEGKARAVLGCFRRVEIDDAAIKTAVQIRRAKELLLPDAIIAASAITGNATVLSNDPHLRDYIREGYKARSL